MAGAPCPKELCKVIFVYNQANFLTLGGAAGWQKLRHGDPA